MSVLHLSLLSVPPFQVFPLQTAHIGLARHGMIWTLHPLQPFCTSCYNFCLLIDCKVTGSGDSVYQFVLCWVLNTYFNICASLIQTANSVQTRNGAWTIL